MALISAERLHRWKCLYCGSKDKNIVDVFMQDPETGEKWAANKIVTCSQCGYTQMFSHSALAHAAFIKGVSISINESNYYVKRFHNINHEDPMRNPHAEHDTNMPHNSGVLPKHQNTN